MTAKQTSFVLLGLFTAACVARAVVVDLASPEVFDPFFYVNTNVEVLQAGVFGVEEAKNHWLQHGIYMGLQACGKFHSKQYLARYPDLTAAFGNDYEQAVRHYLVHRVQEGRLGYVEGGFEGRWTISESGHGMHVSASSRMGAAIDSLVWNNKEFINCWDHGRELQMAMNFPPNGECFNPTEAGGRDDFQKAYTHSQIQLVHAEGDKLSTKVHPAFWLLPGTTQHRQNPAGNCGAGDPALNKVANYPHAFAKTVTLRCPGVDTPCLTFNSSFTIAGDIPDYNLVQMTGPAGYAPGDFTKHLTIDPTTGLANPITDSRNTHPHPILVATQDDKYAIGVYAPPGQNTLQQEYGGPHFFPGRQTAPSDATHYWSVVFKNSHAQLSGGGVHVQNFYSYICVGTVQNVVNCINTMRTSHESTHLIG